LNKIGVVRFLIVCASPNNDIADIDNIEVSIFSVPSTRSFQEITETPATDAPKLGTATDTFSETLKAAELLSEGRGIAANVNCSVIICTGSVITPIRDAVILLIILTICVVFLLVVLPLVLSDDTSERIFKISVAPEREIFCGICGQIKDGVGVCVLDGLIIIDSVCDGVFVSVCEADAVSVCEADAVSICEGDAVSVSEGDAVSVSEGDAVSVSEADDVPVSEGDAVSVSEAEAEGVPVSEAEADTNVVRVIVIDGVHVIEALRDLDPVFVILGVRDNNILFVNVRVSLTLPVRERVIECVRDDVFEYDSLLVEVVVERIL
jgi:hypothetical protein